MWADEGSRHLYNEWDWCIKVADTGYQILLIFIVAASSTGAPGGDADTAVLPMGCGCWGMAQLLLLPPGWEEVEGRKRRAIADPLVVGRIMGAVRKLRARLSSSCWNKGQRGATMVTEHKRKNFTWHLPFLQANEEKHQSADRLLIFIALSQQLWYFSSYSGS